jgi:parallel beta-helix repeat protein
MTVENVVPYISYTANGSTKTYTIPFYINDKNNFIVKINDVLQSLSAYSYKKIDNTITFYSMPAKDAVIEIERRTPLERSANYDTFSNKLRPESLNAELDRVWHSLQELNIQKFTDVNLDAFDGLLTKYGVPAKAVRDASGLTQQQINSFTITPQQFGAKGDGITDDTAAIQAALDYVASLGGGTVFVPDGIYLVKPQLNLYMWRTGSSNRANYGCLHISDNCSLVGSGHKAIIKLNNTIHDPLVSDARGPYATTHIIINSNALGLPRHIVNRNIEVRNLAFNSNWVHESGEAVTFCGVSQFRVSGCYFENTFYECSYMVFCRNGIWTENQTKLCGLPTSDPLNDGGGPMVDTSYGISVTNNIFVDSGFYAILGIDSWHCNFSNNVISKETYDYSSGYQAIRIAGCNQCIVSQNRVYEAGFNGIWIHRGRDMTVSENIIVKCGYFANAGSQIHGIQFDSNVGTNNGRNKVINNTTIYNNGSGIGVLDAYVQGDSKIYNAGSLIQGNTALYNGRDGLAIYGNSHIISNNIVESNGISYTGGVLGDGYSGIALNGARYCIIEGNTCQDITYSDRIQLNLDAVLNLNTVAAMSLMHTEQTQQWGISELPGDIGELKVNLVKQGLIVTATVRDGVTPHNLKQWEAIHIQGSGSGNYRGYFEVLSVIDDFTFTYSMEGYSPLPLDGSLTEGEVNVSKFMVADYNLITTNNFSNNRANPGEIPVTGGRRVMRVGSLVRCGANTEVGYNIGGDW